MLKWHAQFLLTVVAGLFTAAVWAADAGEGFTTSGRLACMGGIVGLWTLASIVIWQDD